jgi:hypothetical protein
MTGFDRLVIEPDLQGSPEVLTSGQEQLFSSQDSGGRMGQPHWVPQPPLAQGRQPYCGQ